MALRMGSLFSGIGGFCSGFSRAGYETAWANEMNERAGDTFKHNFSQARIIADDIRNIGVAKNNLEPVDVLTAGFPCQSFSQAGRREGFDDERGMLVFEVIRLLKEFGAQRPPILLLENVPYLAYGKGGEWLHRIMFEIQAAGYWFKSSNCKVLDTAKITPIPQRRERLFMVALSTKAFDGPQFRFPEPIREKLPLNRFINRSVNPGDDYYLPEDNRYFQMLSDELENGDHKHIYQLRKYMVRVHGKTCPTLTANMGQGGHNVPFIKDRWGIRKFTEDECLRFQGFPENDFSFPEGVPRTDRYQQIGNTVTVPVVEKLATECAEILVSAKQK